MGGEGILSARGRRRLAKVDLTWAIHAPDGRAEQIGEGEPVIVLHAVNARGLASIRSLSELKIADAYLRGDIDAHGDLIAAMDLRAAMTDVQPLTRAWNVIAPLLFGRRRMNPKWIAKHYDSENMQLHALDTEYNVYTPGIYESEEDSLEEAAERKLAYAFDRCNLQAGDSVLDVGCGWGGFLRYCAQRDVDVTGISLSRHQLAHARKRLDEDGLDAQTLYEDFFTFEPGRRFDAISLMGSIEDLSNYRKVMTRLESWLVPGGRIYMDFASKDRPWGIASFITRYVWPGAFRMVYLPAFTRALARSHFDIVEMRNDRRNYHLWPVKGFERWTQNRDQIVAATDERTWRLMHLLTAGAAHVMSERSIWATAYRVVLESRATPAQRRESLTARGSASAG